MAGQEVLYPEISVQLSGGDGNAFGIIAKVERALKDGGKVQAATEFREKAFECESYDALLQLAMTTVNVA